MSTLAAETLKLNDTLLDANSLKEIHPRPIYRSKEVAHLTIKGKCTPRMSVTIYSDGASRGNPGDSAVAFIILDETGKTLKKHAAYLGKKTNNQAEYEALISALTATAQITNQNVTCKLDSELVVKQLNGQYRVRNPELKPLWQKIHHLKREFNKVTFTHTARTNQYIKEVDLAANRILNRITKANA